MAETTFSAELDEAGTHLSVSVGATKVATYVFRPDTPLKESPKPYFYPVRTLSGAPLATYRPWDHRWHKGLAMTWSHVSGQNFWGGPTYTHGAPGHGYVWRENHGRQVHRAFQSWQTQGDDVSVHEQLDWIASSGESWISEARTLRFHSADPARGIWALDFATELTNIRDSALELGSPTTHGRPGAGYTGLFWRGPRAWTGARMVAPGVGDGEPVMGRRAPWVAVTSEHDEIDGGATVLAVAGESSAEAPLTWFARSQEFAALNPSPAFDTEISLEPEATLRLGHRFVFIDEVADRARIEELAGEFAW